MRNAREETYFSPFRGAAPIFVQASAEPNDCVKPNEQNRVYSNFAMASNRTFKNLGGRSAERPYCRAQPKISKQKSLIQCFD